MLEIRFEPISSVADAEQAALIAQVTCIFTGEFMEGDFDWDADALLISYIEEMRSNGDTDAAQYAEDEPIRAVQLAKDYVISDVRSILRQRLTALGTHCPFIWGTQSSKLLDRKKLTEIDGVGASYLWFCLFDLTECEGNYVQAENEQVKGFRAIFDDVFEVIACYTIAGRHEQHTWHLGKYRSTAKFLKVLERVVRRAESGKVKNLQHLAPNQVSVNDAGVDGIGLSLRDNHVRNDSVIIYAQATIQKSNRLSKVVGANQITRIKGFFLQHPLAAAQGALVIPYDGTAIDKSNCTDNNCLYITRAEIYQLMGNHPDNVHRAGTYHLDAIMGQHTKKHAGSVRLLTVDGSLAIS